ncbi:MAG: hypothetical protein CFE22_01570 [Cytophagaceae bacterium BCCC1]|nr:MAG: hypothetical protein CFE22_01570 [Cytophagaceae bacterium BCCC1]
MTKAAFISKLKSFRQSITSYQNLNIESPKRLQYLIVDIITYLNKIKTDGALKDKIEDAIKELKIAHSNAEELSHTLKPDFSKTSDIAVLLDIQTVSAWAIQVIGTGEYALDIIIDHMVGNE